MNLRSIRLKNFRCFPSETLELNNYTSLLGPNNVGKSAALRAMDIFFRSSPKNVPVTRDDFYLKKESGVLEIAATFDELSTEEQEEFSHYARGGKLQFMIRSHLTESGPQSQIHGIRLGRQDLKPYFEAKNAAEKKSVYNTLIGQGLTLPKWTKEDDGDASIAALDASNPDLWVEIESGVQAYGAVGPIGLLRKYLDWTFVPAVKEANEEASEGGRTAFTKLIAHAIKNSTKLKDKFKEISDNFQSDVQKVLQDESEPLKELEYALNKEFKSLSSAEVDVNLSWDGRLDVFGYNEPLVRTLFRDGQVLSAPEYFGHGIQRAYILALLPLVAKISKSGDQKQKLLLAIEEPELYQHPPQARFLASALEKLSESGTQTIVATHSPFFVSARKFNDIRKVSKVGDNSKIYSWSIDEHRTRYATILGKPAIGDAASQSSMDRVLQSSINELFFCRKAVFVEGIEDPAIIATYLKIVGKYDLFLRSGCHFIVAGGKGNFPTLLTLAQGFAISTFLVFDFDMDKPAQNRQNDSLRSFLVPLGHKLPETIDTDIYTPHFCCWKDNIQRSLSVDFPGWKELCQKIALDWGWNYDRMEKDPMLLEEGLTRAVKDGKKFPALDELVATLEVYWTT